LTSKNKFQNQKSVKILFAHWARLNKGGLQKFPSLPPATQHTVRDTRDGFGWNDDRDFHYLWLCFVMKAPSGIFNSVCVKNFLHTLIARLKNKKKETEKKSWMVKRQKLNPHASLFTHMSDTREQCE
jgi:hypothetical protein